MGKSFMKSFINSIIVVQTNLMLPLNHAEAMLKISGQFDPDPQRYLRHTHREPASQPDSQTDRQTEISCIYREMYTSPTVQQQQRYIAIKNIVKERQEAKK